MHSVFTVTTCILCPKICKIFSKKCTSDFLGALYNATYTFSSAVPQSMSLNLAIRFVSLQNKRIQRETVLL